MAECIAHLAYQPAALEKPGIFQGCNDRLDESLQPVDGTEAPHDDRCYPVLQLTYIRGYAVDQIIRTLHISRRQYFYDLKDSIEILADRLIRDHRKAVQ